MPIEKYLLAVGRSAESAWLEQALAALLPAGLVVRRRLAGAATPGPDALISLWLERRPDDLLEGLRARSVPALLWRVEEHRQKGTPPSGNGTLTPGVAMVALMRAAPEHARADCQRYWVERHTPLALRVHQGLSSYLQNVVLETLTVAGDDVIGVAELQFPSAEDYRERMFVPPEAREEIFADVPRFMSLETTESVDMDEQVLVAPPPDGKRALHSSARPAAGPRPPIPG